MKRKSNLGYRLIFFISLAVAIANASARGYAIDIDYEEPDPAEDTTGKSKSARDTSLKFPIYDKSPQAGEPTPSSIDLKSPKNLNESVEYNPEDNTYRFSEKLGDKYLGSPRFMTFDEYLKYQAKKDEEAYWKRRMDALSLFNSKPQLPTMYREGLFDRIFGGNTISVRPQGNVDITFGGNWQNIQNPTLPQRAQKYGIFDFDMQMNINLLATVGDKLKLNISNNTKATFDYQNIQRLEYTGKEDEIIKKIEAGNISFPLRSSLISGVQSLFGLKAQLQFGKLWVTGVVSQQRSKRQSMTIQGGAQTQQFSIKADDYEENKHFLLSQYFYNNYNRALQNYPIINSQVTINKIEVWVTNRTGAVEGVRTVYGFMDLGEGSPNETFLLPGPQPAPFGLPDNNTNSLYTQLQQNPAARTPSGASTAIKAIGLTQAKDFTDLVARKLNSSEYSFNSQLGYISLNTTLNPDDVLAVAFRYTYNGKVYQVGEFAEDLPPLPNNQNNVSDQRVLFLKLLKGTSNAPTLPIWNLMMKNVYALGGLGVSKDEFRLNVLYQDPGGGEKRYIPEGDKAGTPLITILNLDRLNAQNDPAPDGIFDFVEGFTINTQQGKIIFPVLKPFGEDMKSAIGSNAQLQRKYLYNILYDSTKTIARQFQQNNRYVIKGSYKSSSSSEIFLGGFNIPQGSVSVTAGGQKLVENTDYQIDYGLGRLKILNSGILNSGIPINVQYEDNATFGFQQQNFTGLRLDYFVNDKLTIGGTYMRLSERPFTQKTTFGEDPIKNTVIGVDANYQGEAPGLTRILDKLPIYSTTAPSLISVNGEVAGLLPGHAKQINALDPEGSVYVDDFEGTRGSYDLKFPANSWALASTPFGATDKSGRILFPEAEDNDKLSYGRNRARLAWYMIEPTLAEPSTGIPDWIKKDPNQHYIRLVQQQDVFPNRNVTALQGALSTLDLGFYPRERGPYNFDATMLEPDGRLKNPKEKWGGIMRAIDNSDFEQANIEFIEFWVMDPFINNPSSEGGSLYINLGSISEDVLKDSRRFFENGLAYPKNVAQLYKSVWGYSPQLTQQVTRSFDNDVQARAVQDVGYDGLDDEEEKGFFAQYLQAVANTVTANPGFVNNVNADPSGDDYKYFRDEQYDKDVTGILGRYKRFNNPHGNSPVNEGNATFSNAGTTIPESEDLNRDNTLNTSEDYYQYRIDFKPNMQVGTGYLINKQESTVKLPNGNSELETWYQFKVPIREFTSKVGNISDFRAIRFMRMFLSGFQDSVIFRFARLELGRNNWRRYMFSLQDPGVYIPEDDQDKSDFAVTSVSFEENGDRQPVPYVIPPGVNRQVANVGTGQSLQLNEQALALQVCNLKDGDTRAVFKEVGVDMRQFKGLRMFMHAESRVGQQPLKDGDLRAIIRIGSDFTNNYYEYQVPLKITLPSSTSTDDVWPTANRLDLILDDLVNAKTERNSKGIAAFIPYTVTTKEGNYITVVGNPNIGDSKTMLLGVTNPKKTNQTPNDDGLAKCTEVWFNELRMVGLNESPGYAASGKVAIQLADLGTVNLGGTMHTAGYGNIDQKLNQRFRDNFYQYNASTNLNVGKLMPRKWGVQLPVFVGYSENISNPQYDPYDLDVKYKDRLNAARDGAQRDSLRKIAQDYTSITSFNLSNVRVLGNPEKQAKQTMPWSVKNFDVSYAYNRQFKRNPIIQSDDLVNHKIGLGYAYNIKAYPIEPFKRLIKSKSKWWALLKDFNINLLPSNFTFRTDLNKIMNETLVRNITDGPVSIQPTYYKNFTWSRIYETRWELTRSLSFSYRATNNSRIDEPYGRIDNDQKRDSLWNGIWSFGRNTYYSQDFSASYNVPLQKLPILDWTNIRLQYGATYAWTAASRLAYNLGNTLGNTQSKTGNLELQFTQLYNKNKWLRTVNQPKPAKSQPDKLDKDKNQPKDLRPGSEVKDLTKKSKVKGKPVADADTSSKNKDMSIAEKAGNMTNKQLDSLHKVQKAEALAKAKADKEKKKKERKLARQKRKAAPLEVTDMERFTGRLLTMVKRTTVNFTESAGSTLPGYMDSTRFFGLNTSSGAPGLDYIYGMQPTRSWLEQQAAAGRISRDSLFNGQFQQQYSQTLNITTTIEPIKDFRVDVTINRSFSKSLTEVFKDTTLTGNGTFTHNNPYETGSFTSSFIGLKTLFNASDVNQGAFKNFRDSRPEISTRLSERNPYSNGVADPNDPAYKKGYTAYSQDVLVPAFLAAYSGKGASKIGLVEASSSNMRSNPFRNYMPMPNWRVAYTGLTKIPFIANAMNNLVINHAYTGTMSMNSFVSTLYYQDVFSMGFPSFIDSNSGNFVPFYQVPNITISESLNPLFGIEGAFRNGMSLSFNYRKTRTASLSMIDYQVSETNSTEYTIGAGYRVRGLVLPFEVFGVRKLKNDLNIKVDIGLRDDKSTNNYLAQNQSIVTRGQKVITISPTINYIVSDKLTLIFFYDRRQSIPYVSTSYPITTTRAGVTLRFIFAQ